MLASFAIPRGFSTTGGPTRLPKTGVIRDRDGISRDHQAGFFLSGMGHFAFANLTAYLFLL
jgi:hypothetical protein